MSKEKDKSLKLNMELNSIKTDDSDPTILRATWILHDFNISANNMLLDKDVSLEAKHTILHKPILAYYYDCLDFGTPTDALGDHCEYKGFDREGNEVDKSGTTPIGTITTEAYIMVISDGNGGEKEVMACDSILWKARFKDACDLLMEWYSRGIKIISSCEYYFRNFTVENGITKIHSPIVYDGHCILNSEERGGIDIVTPAYSDSVMLSLNEANKFTKLVSQVMVKEICSNREENVEVDKSTNTEENKDIKVDNDAKDDKIAELKAEIVELKAEIKELKGTKDTVEKEKKEVSEKLIDATEKLTSLSEEVKELNSYKEKYVAEANEKALNEKKEYYESKFKALNSVDKFNEESTQDLIAKSIKEDDEGMKAIMSLNSMLIDMVTVTDKKDVEDKKIVKEVCNSNKELINIKSDFDSKYQ